MIDNKETLEQIRLRSLNHIRNILPSIKLLEEELKELQREHKDYKEQYEEADKALAELDGRLNTIPTGMCRRKPIELKLDQINSVAKKLGIKL